MSHAGSQHGTCRSSPHVYSAAKTISPPQFTFSLSHIETARSTVSRRATINVLIHWPWSILVFGHQAVPVELGYSHTNGHQRVSSLEACIGCCILTVEIKCHFGHMVSTLTANATWLTSYPKHSLAAHKSAECRANGTAIVGLCPSQCQHDIRKTL